MQRRGMRGLATVALALGTLLPLTITGLPLGAGAWTGPTSPHVATPMPGAAPGGEELPGFDDVAPAPGYRRPVVAAPMPPASLTPPAYATETAAARSRLDTAESAKRAADSKVGEAEGAERRAVEQETSIRKRVVDENTAARSKAQDRITDLDRRRTEARTVADRSGNEQRRVEGRRDEVKRAVLKAVINAYAGSPHDPTVQDPKRPVGRAAVSAYVHGDGVLRGVGVKGTVSELQEAEKVVAQHQTKVEEAKRAARLLNEEVAPALPAELTLESASLHPDVVEASRVVSGARAHLSEARSAATTAAEAAKGAKANHDRVAGDQARVEAEVRSLVEAEKQVRVAANGAAGLKGEADKTPTILGPSLMTAAEIAAWYNKAPRTNRTASPVGQLAKEYVEEFTAEGVRADVAFAQAMLETGGFSSPLSARNNFAGIGACDSCATGYDYSSTRLGVRAQAQLLRTYATPGLTTSQLANPPVRLVPEQSRVRGKCQTYGSLTGVWATDTNYGAKVMVIYHSMLASAITQRLASTPGTDPPPAPSPQNPAPGAGGAPPGPAAISPGSPQANRPLPNP